MAKDEDKVWKKFMQRHWQMFAVMVLAAILAAIAMIYVFIWFVGDAQATGLVPRTLDLWSMGFFVTFLFRSLLWEVIFIGIPVFIAIAAIYSLWWKKLPDAEREEYREGKLFKRSKGTDGGGFFSFLIFVVFCILIYLDGNWGSPFATWTLDYLVFTCLWALFWVAIIFGIPILIGGSLYLRYIMNK